MYLFSLNPSIYFGMKTYLHSLHTPQRGGQLTFSRRPWLLALLAVLGIGCLSPQRSHAQLAASYAFAKSTTAFSPLASGTPAPTPTPMLLVDTGNTPALPLGFTFRFEGVNYTSVVATSDGYLSFNPNAATVGSDYGNDMGAVHQGNDPLVAALWDDLSGTQPGAAASYVVTGTAPNRVFTFEWLNWGWDYSAAAGSVSFQIKLREGSNQIEMVYRPEAGAVVNPSASVGLRSVGGTGPGTFLSVSDLTPAAVASNAVAYNSIAVKPTAGLTFTFTPTACAVLPVYASLPISQSFEASWTDACATRNAASPSWRTTPLLGDNSWRRDDDGAAASWQNPTSYLPTPVASQGSHAAVFHSSYAAAGTTGSLDLYANLSGPGTKLLTFDYSNNVAGTNADHLDVLLSTDGGATFNPTPLLTAGSTGSTGYTRQTVAIPSTSATTVIRFLATGDYGYSDIGLDNVALTAATCPPPTALTASSITSTSANLTFTPASGATSYVVTYTRQGSAAQTVSTTTSPVALSGLTPASVYTASVVTNCGGGATSAATTTITFTTTPANDLCANAPALALATTCTSTSGTVGGATTSAADGKLDVWFTFSATSTEHHVVVTGATGATISAVTEIYAGSTCPGSSAVPLVYNSSSSDTYLTGLTPTQVYYVRVYDFYNLPLSPTAGAFNICVTRPFTPTPANDLCANAQLLTPATPCVATTGTVGGALAAPALDTNDDVWYSFVATSTRHNILVTPTAGANLVTQVYTSACPSSTSAALISNASSNNTLITGLTAGQTYRVRVHNFYSASGFLSPAAGAFTICVDRPTGTATRSGLQADQVSLYPNPAHAMATLLVAPIANATTATTVLLDGLGRTVWQRALPLTGTGIQAELDLRALPAGVYTLRLQAGSYAPVTKRLTLE